MKYFMSEEEAIAIIDERMEEIVAKMASGTTADATQHDSTNATGPAYTEPCNGTCIDGICCNCCYC